MGDSITYRDEELKVYNQLLDNFLDSMGFEVVDIDKKVFYLSDTLYNIDNDSIKVKLNNRA